VAEHTDRQLTPKMTNSARAELVREHVYCDESSTSSDRFMVIGSVWLTPLCEEQLRSRVKMLREQHQYPHELKWTRAGGRRFAPILSDVIDLFFDSDCRFGSIVVDRTKKRLHPDHELAFYVHYHWLLRKRYQAHTQCKAILDHRDNKDRGRLGDLWRVLNNSARKDYAVPHQAFLEVRSGDSRKDELLQLVDLLTGCVAWHLNRREYAPGASSGKRDLGRYIAQRAQRSDRLVPTSPQCQKFNIWRWTAP